MASTENTSSHSAPPTRSSSIADDIDKPSSPYFPPSADNPGIVLVLKPLTTENCPWWTRSMTKALSAKNKLGFVNGSIPEPSDPDSPLYQTWWRCNDMVGFLMDHQCTFYRYS